MQDKRYYPSFLKSILLLILSSLLVGLILWYLIITGMSQLFFSVLSVAVMLLFGFGVALFASHVLRIIFRKPILIISANGIVDYTDFLEYGQFIAWKEMTDVRIVTQTTKSGRQKHTHKYVCLRLKNPEEFARKANWIQRHLMRANKNLTKSSDIYINCAFLAAKPAQVRNDILEMAKGRIRKKTDESMEISMDASLSGVTNMLLTGKARDVTYSDKDKREAAEASNQQK